MKTAPVLLVLLLFARDLAAQNEFEEYRSTFRQKTQAALGAAPLETWDTLSVYLRTDFVATTTQAGLNTARPKLELQIPEKAFPSRYHDFEIRINCPSPCPDCDQGWPPARIACQIATAPCRISFAALIAPCHLARAVTGGHATGAIGVEGSASASLPPTDVQVEISPTLNELRLHAPALTLSGHVRANARLRLTGDARLLTLCYTTSLPLVDTDVTARVRELPLRATVETEPGTEGLKLTVTSAGIPLGIQFDISPVFSLAIASLRNAATCPTFALLEFGVIGVANAATGGVAGAALGLGALYDQTVGIQYPYTFQPNSFETEIADVRAKLPDGSTVEFSIRPRPEALGMVQKQDQ